MNRTTRLGLSVLTGLLLGLSWPLFGFTPLIFVAFFPLLKLEHYFATNPDKFKTKTIFWYAYLAFFTWNLVATWWVYEASFGGAAFAFVFNSLFMALTFMFAHAVKRRIFKKELQQGQINFLMYVPFILFWVSFEYFHTNWQLAYPWLTLGNGLAGEHKWIQWYEFTGVFGGSLWILCANVLFFIYILKKEFILKLKSRMLWRFLAHVLVPIGISLGIYFSYNNNSKKDAKSYKIVVVQPNVDPYKEKFTIPYEEQLEKMLKLAETKLDSSTDYLVFPETALTEDVWENDINKNSSVIVLHDFMKKYPKLVLITGASTSKVFNEGEKLSETAQKFKDADQYYDNYNTALQFDHSGKIQVYHKSKLVPGVERMPFPSLLKPLEKLALDLGGTVGSLATQEDRTPLVSPANAKVAPIICYESIFSEFVSEYVKNGAQALFIITNDGWWGDTPGYKQHLVYGRLRTIETRKCIARSANTGISCFINERGDISQMTDWWKPAVISAELPFNDTVTFYVKHGDYIARAAVFLSLLLIVYALLIRFNILKKA